LASCGFQPVYGPSGDGTVGGEAGQELAAVDVALAPEHTGQIIRHQVQERLDRFGSGVPKRYSLAISLSFYQDQAGIQPDSSVTFIRMRAVASWRLTLLDPKLTLITTGNARAMDGFNVIDQQIFATQLETESVETRLSERVSDEIALQLALYFKHHGNAHPPA
jgi:LPS-assembly lipoprotein